MNKNGREILFPIVLALTGFATVVSLISEKFYHRDSIFMAVKCHYLDFFHLWIVIPLGIICFILIKMKKEWAKLVKFGILSYLAFMFGFNAFSLYFNELFLVYIAVFSLSIFDIVLGYDKVRKPGDRIKISPIYKIAAGVLLLFALTAYTMWLIEVISSTLHDTIPELIAGMNLPSSATHVFDMGFALPVIVIGAILVFRNSTNGLIISTGMSVFVFLISISLLVMELALKMNDLIYDEGIVYSAYIMIPLSILPLISLTATSSRMYRNHK